MKNIIVFVILVALAWKGYEKYSLKVNHVETTREHAFNAKADVEGASNIDVKPSGQSTFVCDGRTYCSQMKSCDEAKYFIQHCPNVKMDGNNDGIPCEKQWCT